MTMISDDLLLGVKRPARYIGEEWNVSRKDFAQAKIRFALCFPDMYEVGMSNLGLRLIYALTNAIDGVVCERFFAADTDLEKLLRAKKMALVSLESQKSLREFDLIGFSLGYELAYTNVLNMLELGGIPLESRQRRQSFPLVIGGGPTVLNPEPLHEFFDLFLLGEAEEAIVEIIDVCRKFRSQAKGNKEDLLLALCQIEGVYVPDFYTVEYDGSGRIAEFKPKLKGIPLKIKKRFVKNLDTAYFPGDWLVPYLPIVHDRINLELMRGCPNQCHFCQARTMYFPLRTRKAATILNLADALYRNSGYEEIALSGLSVSDYPNIEEVLNPLVERFREKGIGISLPSIKPREALGKLTQLLATIKKTGLTFAPEAATERMRRIIGKNFDEDVFFTSLEEAYRAGYQHIKLYFMIGLPFEENKDLEAILDFAKRASDLRRKIKGSPAQVNVSINTLIPKPHTPLQWFGMLSLEEIKEKQDYLRIHHKNRRLKLSFHNRFMSILEGIFSRGDRRLSPVIFKAFSKGARFDGWSDYFIFNYWTEAFQECKINPNFYLQARKSDELLPWDFLDVGIEKARLAAEFNKIIAIK